MSSNVTQTPPNRPLPGSWQANDAGPSMIRTEDPTLARVLGGMGGALFVVLGGLPLLLLARGKITPIGPGFAILFLSIGIIGLLFHAALDWDVQFRRIYMAFGFIVLALGVFLMLLPYPNRMGDQFLKGFVCTVVGLLFLLAFLRNEDDPWYRKVALSTLGVAGAAAAVVGLFGGNLKGEFLMPYGMLLALVGLAYLTAYIMVRGISDDLAYRVGLALGAVGLVVIAVALVRSALPPRGYLVPNGLLLMFVGVLYAATALVLCSDNRLVVLTRRELGSQFCSPIAYMVLFAYVFAHWLAYWMYLGPILRDEMPVPEPMIQGFILQWMAVLFTIPIVPILTMRLLSEEKRTGTMEVLLTVPVDEGVVVLSKFLAAWIMFLFIWIPFVLFLVALRIDGGQPFDYMPLFSFFTGLAISGAGFVGMGVFFSSLTRNQIISCVLSLVGMLFLTMTFMIARFLQGTVWNTVLKHMSYIDVWFDTLEGKLVPIRLLFFASMAIFFLFLSVKVLEARKWT